MGGIVALPTTDPKRFFNHIISKNLTGAKLALKEDFVGQDKKGWGQYMAARGMVSMLDNKNIDDGIFEDREKMSRLKKQLAERIDSIWSDDFDRGFFETWIGFINYYRRHGLPETSGKQSVDQNPDEQKKQNKATQPTRD